MAYDRNASARAKGFRNYYEYRKAQSQAKGFENPYEEQKAQLRQRGFSSPYAYTEYRKEVQRTGYGQVFREQRNPVSDYLIHGRGHTLWDNNVPEPLQNSPSLQKAFSEGFLKPIGIGATGGPLTQYQKEQRAYFLSIIEDFDWDDWQEFVEEEGDSPGGEQ